MKKVVLFIRKSTIHQEYDHQENLLIDVCKKNDWEIVSTIRETISAQNATKIELELVN